MLGWLLGYLFVLPVLCFDIKNDLNYTTTPESIHFMNLDPSITCKFQINGFDCEGTRWLQPKFYYDIKLEDCKSSSIGSCPYNLNAFTTLSDCHNTCRVSYAVFGKDIDKKLIMTVQVFYLDVGASPVPSDLPPRIFCRLQFDFGHCNSYHPRWYFDMTVRRCRGFSYSGCGGNQNRFHTQQACATACGGATEHKPEGN